jgi:hypothetical protein
LILQRFANGRQGIRTTPPDILSVKQVDEPQILRRNLPSNSKLWSDYPATQFSTISEDMPSFSSICQRFGAVALKLRRPTSAARRIADFNQATSELAASSGRIWS